MKALFAASCLVYAASAWAQTFPARTGEAGILDVPDAEVVGPGGGQLGIEFGVDRVVGERSRLGPLPIYAVGGLGSRIDAGLTMRESGQPGDPLPRKMGFGAAMKLQLLKPEWPIPGAALSTVLDRFNETGVIGTRLALSASTAAFRVAAFGGVEAFVDGFRDPGPTAGVAASLALSKKLEFSAEALTGPRGENFGAAVGWAVTQAFGTSLGANYFPGEDAFRVSLRLAFSPASKPKPVAPKVEPTASLGATPATAAPRFTDDRPRFRLRFATRSPALAGVGHLQYAPPTARVATADLARPQTTAAGVRSATPSLEDLAEAQMREQEALAEARERRVRNTSDQLDAREKASLAEAARLEQRERELTAREQQLDARERLIAVRGAPTQQQRQLESLESQLAAQERQLLAQERSLTPAIEAASGRERDAAAREETERQEAGRLAASAASATSRTLQVDLRKQALAAKNRQLASLEMRLVSKGERIDGLERQLRVKGERLGAWSRRLDTRSERLDLIEKRATESLRRTAPKPTESKVETAPKDKAVFVMVVKSPTAIVKERGASRGAPQAGSALHPGVAVEKAVAAATVVTFPTPTSQLSELDRETIDNIAKLAGKERCELLIWARAKDSSLMTEAQRRADEIKTRAIATGPLDSKQIVTRITTRPGAQGVDVVVSALRETATPTKDKRAPTGPRAPALLPGESGKRQIREAVQAAQKSIEACVGELIEAKRLQRAEGVLKLTVSTDGRVAKVLVSEGDLTGSQMESCLDAASRSWSFPAADGEYVVDVPITVMRGGAK